MTRLFPRLLRLAAATLAFLLTLLPPADARQWTDLSGRTVEAEFVSSDAQTVTLKSLRTGKEVKVLIEQLSLQDRAEILRLLRERVLREHTPAVPVAPADPRHPPTGPMPPPSLLPPMPDPPANAPGSALMADLLRPGHTHPQPLARIRELGAIRALVLLLLKGVLLVLIYALGLHITSLFLDFKETFGTALVVAIGSAGFRLLATLAALALAHLAPALAETLQSPISRWAFTALLYFPFDVFLIRRVYREHLGTCIRAGFLYIVWGNLIFLLLGVVTAGVSESAS